MNMLISHVIFLVNVEYHDNDNISIHKTFSEFMVVMFLLFVYHGSTLHLG